MKQWMSVVCIWGLFVSSTLAADNKVLYFFNWSEYMPEIVLEQFTKETGIKVIYSTYDSNEAMYAKLKLTEGEGYDIAVPSTYYVSKMRKEGLLHPIDKTLLKNFGNLDERHTNRPFDPENKYSVPYLWGSTGLCVNADEIDPDEVQGWEDLWKPELKGKILMMNDPRDLFFIGLHLLGYSGNTIDETQIEAAYHKLVTLMPSVKIFNSDSPKIPYLMGEVIAGMIWNGEAYMAAEENPAITYIYPKEGTILWMDSFVIPKNAKHVAEAHQLIDFLLKPHIAKIISEEIGYASTNKAAIQLLDPEVQQNRTVYPTAQDLRNSEYQIDVGEAITIYERYWEKLKAVK